MNNLLDKLIINLNKYLILLPGYKQFFAKYVPQNKKREHLYQELAQHNFVEKLTLDEKLALSKLSTEVTFKADEFIFKENDPGDCLYLILQGKVLIYKIIIDEFDNEFIYQVDIAEEGTSVGEMNIIDSDTRTAHVKAITPVKALCYPFSLKDKHNKLHQALIRCTTRVASRKLRHTSNEIVSTMKKHVKEARARIVLAYLMMSIFWILGIYILSLKPLLALRNTMEFSALITVGIIVLMVIILFAAMIKTKLPLTMFGLTLHNWKKTVKEAVAYSLLVCFLGTILKLLVIVFATEYNKTNLFEVITFFSTNNPYDVKTYLICVLIYLMFCPLQEFATRSVVQGTLYNFLPGEEYTRAWNSIILSNLLFSAAHSHLNITFSFIPIAFATGLFWGWLFYKQNSLLGVTVSHGLIGTYYLFILGPLGGFFF